MSIKFINVYKIKRKYKRLIKKYNLTNNKDVKDFQNTNNGKSYEIINKFSKVLTFQNLNAIIIILKEIKCVE